MASEDMGDLGCIHIVGSGHTLNLVLRITSGWVVGRANVSRTMIHLVQGAVSRIEVRLGAHLTIVILGLI